MVPAAGLRLVLLLVAAALVSEAGAHPGDGRRMNDLDARIEADPDNPALYLRRAELHRARGDRAAARADLERCRRLDPDLAVVDLHLGRIWIEAGEPARGLDALDRYLRSLPADAAALALRGRGALALGRDLEAAADITGAIEAYLRRGHNPPPDWYLARARALVAAGPDHLPEALRGLEAGIRELGAPVTLQMEALELERRLGRTGAAVARVDRMIEAAPAPARWLARRGEILAEADRCDEAVDSFARALAAIDALPESRRSAGAFRDMEIRIGAARVRCLAAGDGPPEPVAAGQEGR
jgi:predicted Zn-dependent protease